MLLSLLQEESRVRILIRKHIIRDVVHDSP
jgi:hypothetical protein